jgi:hypothetical protein
MKRSVRLFTAGLAVAAISGAMAAPAGAWPLPLTADQTRFLDSTRGGFPGDDDQLLMAGLNACHLLYSGQASPAVIDATAAQYGASADQAAHLVSAARATMCTQAPG